LTPLKLHFEGFVMPNLFRGVADTSTWGEVLKTLPNLKLPLLTNKPDEKLTISRLYHRRRGNRSKDFSRTQTQTE
jgi:hypothetical protein